MANGTRVLKLVGAKSYVGPRTDNKLIQKNETYAFKEEDAEALLKETQRDASNNDRPLFVEVAGGTEDAPATAKVVRKRATAQ